MFRRIQEINADIQAVTRNNKIGVENREIKRKKIKQIKVIVGFKTKSRRNIK